jgi:hypothetical protein
MRILSVLKRLVLRDRPRDQVFNAEQFVYLMLPDPIGPLDRGSKYEGPLDQVLRKGDLGSVSGGGSQLGEADENGNDTIEYCGVDIEIKSIDSALKVLRDYLPLLGAPMGSQIHYTRDGARLQDEYTGGSWHVAQPRENLHPYFQC